MLWLAVGEKEEGKGEDGEMGMGVWDGKMRSVWWSGGGMISSRADGDIFCTELLMCRLVIDEGSFGVDDARGTAVKMVYIFLHVKADASRSNIFDKPLI